MNSPIFGGFSLQEDFLDSRSYYSQIPKHVLLLPDGQRRYAEKIGLKDKETYELARKAMDRFLAVAFNEYRLKESSLFLLRPHSFSKQKRTKENVRQIFRVIREFSEDMSRGISPIEKLGDLKFRAITLAGKEWMKPPRRVQEDKDLLEDWLRLKEIFSVLQEKYNTGSRRLNFLVNYSGKAELEYALKHGKGKLQITNDIGLTIRCGDSLRLSDCPLYALGQSHLYLIEKSFPEVSKKEFRFILSKYFKK